MVLTAISQTACQKTYGIDQPVTQTSAETHHEHISSLPLDIMHNLNSCIF